MKCITHNHVDSVGQCNTCGGGMCKECMHNFTNPICPECNLKWWENRRKEILGLKKQVPLYSLAIGFILLIFSAGGLTHINDTLSLIIILILYYIAGFFIYFGWLWISDLNKNGTTIRVNDTIIAMIIRNIFKIIFALIIGIFVCPYKIYQLRKEYKESMRMIDICKDKISKNVHS